MSGTQSLISPLENVQVVARLWVAGKGCRYFHSDNLNDRECQSLFDELTAAHAWSIESSGKTFVGPVPGRKGAFFVHERVPDPNNSNRKVTNSWFLLDKSGILTLQLAEAFAQRLVYAETQADFVNGLRQADLTSIVVSPTLKLRDPAIGTNSDSAPSIKKLVVVLCVSLPVILLIVLVSFALFSKQDSAKRDPHNQPTAIASEELDSRWGSEELKLQLREAVGHATANNLDDKELLESFLRLFSFDPEVLRLSPEENADVQKQLKDSPPNPFAKFLLDLPRSQANLDRNFAGSTPMIYRDRLTNLASKICTDRNGQRLNATNLNPVEIVKALRDRRDYDVYYERWHNEFQPNQKEDPWLNQWQEKGTKSWIPKVRDFIQESFD